MTFKNIYPHRRLLRGLIITVGILTLNNSAKASNIRFIAYPEAISGVRLGSETKAPAINASPYAISGPYVTKSELPITLIRRQPRVDGKGEDIIILARAPAPPAHWQDALVLILKVNTPGELPYRLVVLEDNAAQRKSGAIRLLNLSTRSVAIRIAEGSPQTSDPGTELNLERPAGRAARIELAVKKITGWELVIADKQAFHPMERSVFLIVPGMQEALRLNPDAVEILAISELIPVLPELATTTLGATLTPMNRSR